MSGRADFDPLRALALDATKTDMKSIAELLPELRGRMHGRDQAAIAWLTEVARSDQAVAYSALFWPSFAIVEGHILRAPATSKDFMRWRKQNPPLERHDREALWNTLGISDDLFRTEEETPLAMERAIYIGKVLTEIHRVKLARDFPDRRFIVELWDGTRPEHGGEVSLSFWQEA